MDKAEHRDFSVYDINRSYRQRKWRCIRTLSIMVIVISCESQVYAADIYETLDDSNVTRYTNHPINDASTLIDRYLTTTPVEVNNQAHINERSRKSTTARSKVDALIANLCAQYGVSPNLVHAVIDVESAYNPSATSAKGARGAMQLMPATGARYGLIDPFNVEQNIAAGIQHLKKLIDRYDGNLSLVLAAYNAGEGAVDRNGTRIPPYRETMLYVSAVLAKVDINTHKDFLRE